MAFIKSSNYQMLKSISIAAKTTNVEPSVAYSSSSYSSPGSCASSEFSSAYISPNLTPTHELDVWMMKKSPSQFDSLDRSVKVDPWSTEMKCENAPKMNFTNNLTTNDIARNESSALDTFSFLSSALDDITYSPLSSFNDTASFYNGSQSSGFYERLQYEIIRREFEMNGTTSELLPPFEPIVTSTPSPSRRRVSQEFSSIKENLMEWSCSNNIYQTAAFNKRQGFEAKLQKFNFKSSRVIPATQKRGNKPNKKSLGSFCVFCKNNGEEPTLYNSHTVEDAQGRCLCPILRQYKCPICKLDGDKAHTTKYCPKRKIFTEEDMQKADSRSRRKSALKF